MEKRYQVFVSSTFADLEDERKHVIQALLEMDCIPAGMELFPAMDEEQFEFIKRIIDDCDYYLLIIGGRYGSVTTEGISYTELEYEYALERGIKVIALLHEKPEQIAFDKSEQNPELRLRLQEFRNKVATGRLVKFWVDKEQLPGIVALSLSKTIKMFPAVGWVRADKVSSEELLTEINELRKQNAELSKALAEVEPRIFSVNEEKDFLYIYNQLDRFVEMTVIIRSERLNQTWGIYSINLATIAPIMSLIFYKYDWAYVKQHLLIDLIQDQSERRYYSISDFPDNSRELEMFGLIIGQNDERNGRRIFIFTEKLQRYKYWLTVNDKMPERIQIIKKDDAEITCTTTYDA